jgi:hypothetical protein
LLVREDHVHRDRICLGDLIDRVPARVQVAKNALKVFDRVGIGQHLALKTDEAMLSHSSSSFASRIAVPRMHAPVKQQ